MRKTSLLRLTGAALLVGSERPAGADMFLHAPADAALNSLKETFATHFRGLIGIGAALILMPSAAAFAPPLSAAPGMTSPPAPSASDPATRAQGDLVNLRVNASYDAPGLPFKAFVEALKTYPNARRFRVSWSLLIFMNGMNSTVLYDRRRHTLRLFSYGGGDVVGSYRDHVLYTGVRASAFAKIAAAHKNDSEDMSVWSWFGDLPRYGCRKRDLGSWEKSPSR